MIFYVRVQIVYQLSLEKIAAFRGCFIMIRCKLPNFKSFSRHYQTRYWNQQSTLGENKKHKLHYAKFQNHQETHVIISYILRTSTSNKPTSRLWQLVDRCVCSQNKFILDINLYECMSTDRCDVLCILSFINKGKQFDEMPM